MHKYKLQPYKLIGDIAYPVSPECPIHLRLEIVHYPCKKQIMNLFSLQPNCMWRKHLRFERVDEG